MLTKEQIEKQLAYWRSNPGHGPTFADFELVAETALDALAEMQRLREERDAALARVEKLREAGLGLKSIVEGIQGAMEHGTWRSERSNLRMKDTEEWVTFYNVLAALEEDTRHG